MRIEDRREGEWIEPVHDGYKVACCDCGLVHLVDFKIRDGKQVQMRVWAAPRSTGQVRRHMREGR